MMEPHTTTEDFYETIEEPADRNAYREAALLVLPLIQAGVGHCLSARSAAVGMAQIKFALGIEGRSMRDVAATLGVTVQCLSRGARDFVHANNLPIPPCMKSEDASEAYRKQRESQLEQ